MSAWRIWEWCLFGDSAYRHHSRTHSYGVDADFNGKMKSVRISIEWNYGTTAFLFTLIGMKEKFKQCIWDGRRGKNLYCGDIIQKISCMPLWLQTMNYYVVLQEDFLECFISGRNLVHHPVSRVANGHGNAVYHDRWRGFMRDLYELCTGAKKTMVSETFGRLRRPKWPM